MLLTDRLATIHIHSSANYRQRSAVHIENSATYRYNTDITVTITDREVPIDRESSKYTYR